MEYQNIINLSDSTPNESSQFRTKKSIEKNNDSGGTYIHQ